MAFNSTWWEDGILQRYYTAISPEPLMYPRWRMDGNDLSNYGQARYRVVAPGDVNSTGGLTGGQILFGADGGRPAGDPINMEENAGNVDPDSFSMSIVGGVLDIGTNDEDSSLGFKLPFDLSGPDEFGDFTKHDYYLSGTLDIDFGGATLTFEVIPDGDTYVPGFPYSGLNVGNEDTDLNAGDGSTDLAMILYARAECSDDTCPFYIAPTPDAYARYAQTGTRDLQQCRWEGWPPRRVCRTVQVPVYDWVEDESCRSQAGLDIHEEGTDGTFSGAGQVNTLLGTNWGPEPGDCKRIPGDPGNDDVYIKIGLWGEGLDTPEPATLSLLGLGLVGLGAATRRRRPAA